MRNGVCRIKNAPLGVVTKETLKKVAKCSRGDIQYRASQTITCNGTIIYRKENRHKRSSIKVNVQHRNSLHSHLLKNMREMDIQVPAPKSKPK